MQQILWSLNFNTQLYKTVNDHVKEGMRKIYNRLLNGNIAIGDFSTVKKGAKNNTQVCLKMEVSQACRTDPKYPNKNSQCRQRTYEENSPQGWKMSFT
jgi:hypothetical protein